MAKIKFVSEVISGAESEGEAEIFLPKKTRSKNFAPIQEIENFRPYGGIEAFRPKNPTKRDHNEDFCSKMAKYGCTGL